jgi:hypothetical protein
MGKASKRNGSTASASVAEVVRKNDESSKATTVANVDAPPPRIIGPVERILRIIIIFIGIPTITGLVGVTIAFYGGRNALGVVQPVDWDHDFVFPFVLMMALLLALGQRTNWFNMIPPKQQQGAVRNAPTVILADDEKKKKQ